MPAPRIALRPSPPLLAGLLAALLLASAQVGAQSRPAPVFGVRTGDHAGFGRVVLDLGPGMRPAVSSREGVVTVKVDSPAGSVVPADGARAPRNVAAMVVDDGQLELTLVPGAKLRSYRLGTRLVLDIADPEPAKPAASAVASPAPATADSQHQPGVSVAAPAAPVLPVPPAYVPPPSISPPSISPARPATGAMRSLSGDTRRRAEEDHTAAPAPAASPAAVPSASPGALAPMEVVHLPLLGLSATLASSAGIGPAAPPRAVAVTLPFGSTSGAAA